MAGAESFKLKFPVEDEETSVETVEKVIKTYFLKGFIIHRDSLKA